MFVELEESEDIVTVEHLMEKADNLRFRSATVTAFGSYFFHLSSQLANYYFKVWWQVSLAECAEGGNGRTPSLGFHCGICQVVRWGLSCKLKAMTAG